MFCFFFSFFRWVAWNRAICFNYIEKWRCDGDGWTGSWDTKNRVCCQHCLGHRFILFLCGSFTVSLISVLFLYVFLFFYIFCIFFYFYFNLLDLFHFSTLVQECLVMLTVFFRGSIQSFPILILASLFRGRHSGSLPLLFHQPSPSPSRLSLHLPVFSSRLLLLLLSGRSIDISPISISTSPKLKSQPHRILSPNSSTLTVPLNSLTISAFLSVRQSHCL